MDQAEISVRVGWTEMGNPNASNVTTMHKKQFDVHRLLQCNECKAINKNWKSLV
jgi:hypothetical protein